MYLLRPVPFSLKYLSSKLSFTGTPKLVVPIFNFRTPCNELEKCLKNDCRNKYFITSGNSSISHLTSSIFLRILYIIPSNLPRAHEKQELPGKLGALSAYLLLRGILENCRAAYYMDNVYNYNTSSVFVTKRVAGWSGRMFEVCKRHLMGHLPLPCSYTPPSERRIGVPLSIFCLDSCTRWLLDQ